MSDAAYPFGAPASPNVSLGDITVSGERILTPIGPMPLRGASWTVNDMSRHEKKIPVYAIVLAVVFALACLLGLLFLLIKEEEVTGHLQVSVHNEGKSYQTMIPANNGLVVHWVHQQVGYLRSVSAA